MREAREARWGNISYGSQMLPDDIFNFGVG